MQYNPSIVTKYISVHREVWWEWREGREWRVFTFFFTLLILKKKMHIKLLTFIALILCYFKHPPSSLHAPPNQVQSKHLFVLTLLLYPFPYYLLTPNLLLFPTFGSSDWKNSKFSCWVPLPGYTLIPSHVFFQNELFPSTLAQLIKP